MATLTGCLKKFGKVLHAEDRRAILERSTELLRGGLKGPAAAAQALVEHQTKVRGMLEPLEKQFEQMSTLKQKGGVDTPEFRRWFGDSKVVDAQGKPLVVYHGTGADVTQFKPGVAKAIWFAPDAGYASKYVSALPDAKSNVMPVYLTVTNPLTVDMKGGPDLPRGLKGLLRYANTLEDVVGIARQQGHDGVIFKNRAKTVEGFASDEVAVFRPEQIKSATGNSGAFNPNAPSILNQTWYSALQRELQSTKTGAAPAHGWKDLITGLVNKGLVKRDEVEAVGLPEFLDLQRGKVTREQVLDFVRANGVQVEETVLGGERNLSIDEAKAVVARGGEIHAVERANEENIAGATLKDGQILPFIEAHPDLYYLREGNPDAVIRRELGTKFSAYTLPGGTNYREVLLTLPSDVKPSTRYEVIGQGPYVPLRDTQTGKDVAHGTYGAMREKALNLNAAEAGSKQGVYRSGHWDTPNVLAHVRLNDRTDSDGKRVLLVEEVRGDWPQAMRKQQEAIGNAVDADFEGIVERMKKDGVLTVECD